MDVEIDGKTLEVVAAQVPAGETVVVSESVPEIILENPVQHVVVESSIYAITIPLPGESAYEVAVRNGFNGTEEEWLESLSGDTDAASWDTIIGIPNVIAAGNTADEAREKINAQVAGEYATAAQGAIAESALQPDELPDDLVKNADPRLSDAREPTDHTHTYSDIIDPPSIPATPADIGAQPAGNYIVPGDINDVVRDNDSRLSDTRNPKAHQHPVSDVNGLSAALNGKQPAGNYVVEGDGRLTNARPPTSHRHGYSEIDGTPDIPSAPSDIGAQPAGDYATNSALTTGLAGKANSTHSHTVAQVTGLQSALNAKQTAGNYVEEGDPRLTDARQPTSHRHTYSQIDDTPDLNALPYRPNTWNPNLNSKADVDHNHYIEDVMGLSETLDFMQSDIEARQPAGDYATAAQGAKADSALQPGEVEEVPENIVLDDDPRLTDARTPRAHNHVIGNVTGLQSALDGKQPTGNYVLTNDSRLSNARPPTAHTHSYDDLDDKPSIPSAPGDIGAQPAGNYAVSGHTHTIANVTGLAAQLGGKADASHGHDVEDVNGLQDALDAKQASGNYVLTNDARLTNARTPLAHSHTIANVTGLQSALDGKQVAGSYAPATHSHAIANINGLQGALDSKQASGNYVLTTDSRLTDARPPTAHTHSYNDLDNKPSIPAAPGDIGAQPAGSYALVSHTHTIANVTNLQTTLNGKAATSHTHSISQVTGLQAQLNALSVPDVTMIFHTGSVWIDADGTLITSRPNAKRVMAFGSTTQPTFLQSGDVWSSVAAV